MTLVDHLYVVLLAVAMPIYGHFSWRRYAARIAGGMVPNRPELYAYVVLNHAILFAILIALWWVYERPVADLGLVPPSGPGFWIGLAFVVVMVVAMAIATRKAKASGEDEAADVAKQLGLLRHIMPVSAADYRGFMAVSTSAGIVEELVYRGFLILYFHTFMPLWAAVLASSLIFGLGHSYQGVSGMVKVSAVGLVAGGLYLGSGSIWLPMLAHALFDMQQGAVVRAYLTNAGGSGDGTDAVAPVSGAGGAAG